MNNIWDAFVEEINNFGYTYTFPDDVDYFRGTIPLYGYTHNWERLSIEDVKKISERFEKKEKFVNPKDWLGLFVTMKDGYSYSIRHDKNYDTFWLENLDDDD